MITSMLGVTGDILAMARPSTMAMKKYGIIEQFKRHGINSVINLQKPGEHNSCGNSLEESGFTYDPQVFMDNDMFFYNFGWPDYGVAAIPSIVDIALQSAWRLPVSAGK
ncbi:PREDICTED: protein tyrosine phosphatase domain-containing protein 1-like, partial [Priapulus caudatus]|uniref:Protein tyrosine phosphatase domain-containing protein 1-like n=1 Tax=Priapulus caudatus TaxID=37621 RepID=A0ABM1DUQ3_PRICU